MRTSNVVYSDMSSDDREIAQVIGSRIIDGTIAMSGPYDCVNRLRSGTSDNAYNITSDAPVPIILDRDMRRAGSKADVAVGRGSRARRVHTVHLNSGLPLVTLGKQKLYMIGSTVGTSDPEEVPDMGAGRYADTVIYMDKGRKLIVESPTDTFSINATASRSESFTYVSAERLAAGVCEQEVLTGCDRRLRWLPGSDVYDKGHRVLRVFDRMSKSDMSLPYTISEIASLYKMHENDVYHVLLNGTNIPLVEGSLSCAIRSKSVSEHGIRLGAIPSSVVHSAINYGDGDLVSLGRGDFSAKIVECNGRCGHIEFLDSPVKPGCFNLPSCEEYGFASLEEWLSDIMWSSCGEGFYALPIEESGYSLSVILRAARCLHYSIGSNGMDMDLEQIFGLLSILLHSQDKAVTAHILEDYVGRSMSTLVLAEFSQEEAREALDRCNGIALINVNCSNNDLENSSMNNSLG